MMKHPYPAGEKIIFWLMFRKQQMLVMLDQQREDEQPI